MDLFRFLNPNAPTLFEQGVIINDLTSITWIERYRDAGEFILKARVDSNLRNLLPVGTFISHTNTNEIMMVENLEVKSERSLKSELIFTGRSFETFLENRIVGSNNTFPKSFSRPVYYVWFGPLGEQAKTLIEDHISVDNLIDPDDALPYVSVLSTVPETVMNIPREFERKEVYSQLLEVLAIRNLGLKVIRPNVLSPLGPTNPNVLLLIHQGVDRSSEIILSNDLGDISEVDYFWSNKKVKNCALVTSKWFEIMVKATNSGYDRRVMFVDGKIIDDSFDEEPTGDDSSTILNLLADLGELALEKQKEVIITNVDTTKTFGKYKYGVDFDVGDIVTIIGDYNQTTKMQIIEYVINEDNTGRSEYPTFSAI